jgi:Zn-dependent protease
MFMGLVVFAQGLEFGIPFAIFLALFTLLHELGHAFAARTTGARAEIALDFMAGYAAFVPTRPLTKLERAGISFAGPGVQILVGTIVYVAVRGGLDWPEYGNAVQHAVFWAGPIIGLFNLLPFLPFDGGNIALVGVELFAPVRARQVMQWFTIVATAGALVYMALQPTLARYIFFAIIPLISVLASMNGDRALERRDRGRQALARAEAFAWATGEVQFPDGTVPSPWFRAWQQLERGDATTACHVIVADLNDTELINWWPPDAAPLDALRQLVTVLPSPPPQGRSFSAYVLSGVLLRVGRYEDAAHYAAAAYGATRAPMLAVHVARGAAALGNRGTALAWLRTAATGTPPDALANAVGQASEFDSLRHDPEFLATVSG